MCIHIFFEVEDLIEMNIHTEVQNKEALADVEMAAVTGGNQSMDFSTLIIYWNKRKECRI